MNNCRITYTSTSPLDYRGSVNNLVKIVINGIEKEYCVINEGYETLSWYDDEPFHLYKMNQRVWKYELTELVRVAVKSKEEIAAEESVAKAKEALKAAENALKVVKEQSK